MNSSTQTHTWPELAEALYSMLTGRGAAIAYTFQQVDIHVPAAAGSGEPIARAHWTIDGTIRVSTSETGP